MEKKQFDEYILGLPRKKVKTFESRFIYIIDFAKMEEEQPIDLLEELRLEDEFHEKKEAKLEAEALAEKERIADEKAKKKAELEAQLADLEE